ncbi:MBL fold metallo-hydrolase [Candidatus Beckwithbacteria bacterium]|nr:MBL fold metallo-hydrolase [Candidatus Beckwithbacteria bacterium]
MMITYLGHSSFRIKTANATIITDPYDKAIGFRFPYGPADICTISHNHFDHNNKNGIKNSDCFFIEGPGEYEIKDVMIKGISSFHDLQNGQERGENTIYLIQADDINLCHLGDLGTLLDEKQLKEIHDIDVLMIPVGGIATIGPDDAKKIIKKIDPTIVLPMHYKTEGISETFTKFFTVSDFFKEMELEEKWDEKLNLNASSLPEELEIIALQRKS